MLLLCSGGESQSNQHVIRIPYRNIVIGLLANQLLLQTIATLLIQGTPRIVPRFEYTLTGLGYFGIGLAAGAHRRGGGLVPKGVTVGFSWKISGPQLENSRLNEAS